MKDKIRTCHTCGTRCESWCPVCVLAFDARRPAIEMSVEERIAELESWVGPTEIPFSKIHLRFEELMGRNVWTHEMTGTAAFAAELRRVIPANLAEICGKVPADKLITYGLEGNGLGSA